MRKFFSMSLVLGTLALCLGLVACGGAPSERTVRREYDALIESVKNEVGWAVTTESSRLENYGKASIVADNGNGRWIVKTDNEIAIEFWDNTFSEPYDQLEIRADGTCGDTPQVCMFFKAEELASVYRTLDEMLARRS